MKLPLVKLKDLFLQTEKVQESYFQIIFPIDITSMYELVKLTNCLVFMLVDVKCALQNKENTASLLQVLWDTKDE